MKLVVFRVSDLKNQLEMLVDTFKIQIDSYGVMKHILSTLTFFSSFALASTSAFAQEESSDTAGGSDVVLVGNISASVGTDTAEYGNLPSGMILRTGPNGVEVLDPADAPEVDPSIPRVSTSAVSELPDGERAALKRKLQSSMQDLLTAYDDGVISGDDTIAIYKFLLGLDLPFDETFVDTIERRFGPTVISRNTIDEEDGDTRVTDPNDLLDGPIQPQVTDPIDNNNTYFAP
jgi:hypothetical protein